MRGFGFLHDGSTDTMFTFFRATVFALFPPLLGFDNDTQRVQMEEFMLQFPTDLAPIVGQQVTDDGSVNADVAGRITLMRNRAIASFTSKFLGGVVTECDLIAKATIGGVERGYLFDGTNYDSDEAAETNLTQTDMDNIAAVAGQSVTYTCAPPGSGTRMGIDRDRDGALDGDERIAGTSPSNAGHILGACNDTIDNDGDSLIDLADPACMGDPGRHNENTECADGIDNDGDGNVDLADSHCVNAGDNRERNVQTSGCGLGAEALLALAPFWALHAARRRARRS